MSAYNSSPPDAPSPKGKKRILPKLILIFFIFLAGTTLFLGPPWKEKKESSTLQERRQSEEKQPVSPGATLPADSSQSSPSPSPEKNVVPGNEQAYQEEPDPFERLTEPLETASPEKTTQPNQTFQESANALTCEGIADELHAFFTDLDGKQYIRSYGLTRSSQEHFIALLKKLLDTPPVVTRETDDLYTILTNMAHFFRIIGKDNISLSKAILGNEREKIEDVFQNLYTWAVFGNCDQSFFNLNAPMEQLYEYAGFFLNTMGGRSYLFRRDSRSRILVNYYAVLIIDQMQKRGRNRHGIDIALSLPLLINEIEASNQLIYKEHYLDTLYGLLEKVQQN